MVIALFKETQVFAKRPFLYTCLRSQITDHRESIFIEVVDELLDDNMNRLAESSDFTQDLVHHLIRSSTTIVLVTRFVNRQAEKLLLVKRSLEKT